MIELKREIVWISSNKMLSQVELMRWELYVEFERLSLDIQVNYQSQCRDIHEKEIFRDISVKRVKKFQTKVTEGWAAKACSKPMRLWTRAEVSEQIRIVEQNCFPCSLFVCRTNINILEIFGTLMCMQRKYLKCLKISGRVKADGFLCTKF